MALDDMLDDGEAEPGAARIAAARGIDAVEALGQAREMVGGDAVAMVAHDQQRRARPSRRTATSTCAAVCAVQP